MKIYSHYGFNDFVICLGYKGHVIKDYFYNFKIHNNNFTVNFEDKSVNFHNETQDDWKVTLVDTGEDTMTGGRLKRVAKYVQDEEFFCMTYGDVL